MKKLILPFTVCSEAVHFGISHFISKIFFCGVVFLSSFFHGGNGTEVAAQNNALILDGAYIVLDGGTSTTNIYVVVDQSNAAGIVRLASGGHINSEGQYNFVKWNSGTSTGNYTFPFGVAGTAADYIPFTFNKTTAASSDVSVSTWATNPQNMPHPAISNVAAVSNMIGIPDSVTSAIDRFWDIQSPSVTADLTFSYRGTENTTTTPTDTFKTQHWNGAAWDPQAGPGNPGVTIGIGTVGPIPGQTTFSPWVLTKAGLNATIITSQNLVCNNQCTGTATVASTGGTPPYTYLWSPTAATTSTATGLCAGTYSILVTDAVNTTAIDTVTLTQPSALTSSVIPTNATCNAQCNGSAIINASGGTPGYSYSWNTVPVQTTANATGLCAGNYTCTITDLNNCTQTNTVAISQPTAISLTVSSTAAACSSSTGTAIANASGGTGGFTYSWNPSAQTSQTATGLVAGTYSVIVADANGCTQTQTVTVTSVNTLSVSASSTQASCTAGNGTATAAPSGGASPYTYNWNNGQTTQTATGISAGTYTVIVTDVNGCTQTQTVTVTSVNTLSVSATSTQAGCTASNGTGTATPSGGASPYTYNWNNGQTTQTATGIATGNYTITVTDANGCTQTQTVSVTSINTLIVSATSTQTSCTINDGTAIANPSSGTSPYSYSWNNGQTTQTATGLSAGTYTVTVTDANGCTQAQTANVTQVSGPTASATATAINITLGGNTQLSAAGGAAYSWSPASGLNNINTANPTATPSATTNYCVFVTDGNGCTDSACVTIYVEIPCGDLFIPNAFSPNGDGSNDFECVRGDCIQTLYFVIYDRWGNKMFETADPKICWDGAYKGELANTAVFIYYLEATLNNGEIINKKGNISLIR